MKGSAVPSRRGKTHHVHVGEMMWRGTKSYPRELRRVYRYKPLIGGEGWYPGWLGIPLKDIATGTLELDPGGYYPLHSHPSPEIYYVIGGKAKWTVGGETFLATPGTAIYHPPNVPHRMVNTGTRKLETFWIWYAPRGDTRVLEEGSRLLERMPKKAKRIPSSAAPRLWSLSGASRTRLPGGTS